MRHYFLLIFVSLFLILAACTSATAVDSQPTPVASATVVAATTEMAPTATEMADGEAPIPDTPTLLPTATTEATPTASELTATATVMATAVPSPTAHPFGVVPGRTEAGAYFLGNPDAPITLVDYSDFL